MKTTLSKHHVALAGEFAVLSQLALRGFDANMTLGNTKSVDILISNPRTGKMRRLEVKTHSHNREYVSKVSGRIVGQWRMADKHEKITDEDLFYCFVTIENDTGGFRFYVVPNKVVADFVTASHKYWLETKSTCNDNPIRSFQIGLDHTGYPLLLPNAEDYRNRFDLLEWLEG